jgi:hypothetical protein
MTNFPKLLALAASASMIIPTLAFAQTSAPSTNPSAHSHPSTAPQGPMGTRMMQQGQTKPCSTASSGTSDRTGGNGKTSTASAGPTSNPNGSMKSGGC